MVKCTILKDKVLSPKVSSIFWFLQWILVFSHLIEEKHCSFSTDLMVLKALWYYAFSLKDILKKWLQSNSISVRKQHKLDLVALLGPSLQRNLLTFPCLFNNSRYNSICISLLHRQFMVCDEWFPQDYSHGKFTLTNSERIFFFFLNVIV